MTLSLLLLPLTLMPEAANYTAEKSTVESIEVVRLTDRARQTEVSIVPSIGNMAYEMNVKGQNVFWFPFKLSEFRAHPVFAGNPFLEPWANRLEDDSYYANGRKYILNPALGNVQRDPNQRPIHGLLAFSSRWQVTSMKADASGAEVTSRLEFWRYPELMAQFPFAHTVEMIHRLRDGVLEVETKIENHSAEPMPLAIGYHPYFRVPGTARDDWNVHVAARQHLILSKELIPTGEMKPVNFPDPVSLRNSQLDDVFTDLVRGADGKSEFWVWSGNRRISVVYGPKYKVAIIYAPAGKDFICFEPMTAVTDAFNLAQRGLYKQLQSIAPGAAWTESFWVKPTGF